MALRLVTDDLTAQAVPPHPVALTASEITGLVGLFQGMLDRTERNILDRLDDNARGASERWAKHDAEAAESHRRDADRFTKVETAIETTTRVLEAHLAREHDEDVRLDARLRPIRGSVAWIWAQRRDIVIVLIGVGVLATVLLESVNRILGVHP